MKRIPSKIFLGIAFLLMLLLCCGRSFSEEVSVDQIVAEINKVLEDRLNLTPEQRGSIKAELEDQRTKRKALADQEDVKKKKLEDEMSKTEVDVNVIDTLVEELNAIRGEVIVLRNTSTDNIKKVLTSDQLEVFEDSKLKLLEEEIPEEEIGETVKIHFYSILCSKADKLPRLADRDIVIDENTAERFVSAVPECDYSSGWTFQWGNENLERIPDDFIGEAPASSGYITTQATGGSNGVIVNNIDITNMTQIRTRVVMQEGYKQFKGKDDKSSEFYCDADVAGYDNWEWISNLEEGKKYYCVFFTAPK